jgi:hypothetical protein
MQLARRLIFNSARTAPLCRIDNMDGYLGPKVLYASDRKDHPTPGA